MKALKLSIAAALCAIVGAGCASTPKEIPELDAARAEVQQATGDPLAQEAAGMRLKKADASLRMADEAVAKHRPLAEIQQQAYLAARHAQIAKEQTAELSARKEVEKGEAERNSVLLQARTAEAAVARADAAQSKSDAAVQTAQAVAANDESARLRSELEGLQAKQTERGMVLTLGDVLFATGKAVLLPGATLTVDRLADFLRNRAALHVVIEGHTDSVGGEDYNLDLSQRRALAVGTALVSRGVAAERLESRGRGEVYPSASNDSPGGRQQNRRVEIIFSDEKGQFSPATKRLSGL
jgi:outer membrane protein OmpA-like peptidoglycan-associated protein